MWPNKWFDSHILIFNLHLKFWNGNTNRMKTDKHNNNDSEDPAIKKLDLIIEQRRNENEALKKILEGLDKMKKTSEEKINNKKQKSKKAKK